MKLTAFMSAVAAEAHSNGIKQNTSPHESEVSGRLKTSLTLLQLADR